ncbi:MAG: hypothetical protein WCX32_02450 [Clostridia bacterium]|jgi:hypothetical protein|nr:hypothetical protein [Clostridia bacterium]MDD4275386.1 hypothetical protein [Clostridia bacterium]
MKGFSIKKVILKTALFTLGICILACALLILCFSLLAPNLMADFTDNLGMENISLQYRVMVYNNSNDINDLYSVVYKASTQNNYKFVKEYFPELYTHPDYDEFINFVEETNLANTADLSIKIYLANEDNFLKSAYVTALYKLDKKQDSFNFALNDFLENEDNIIKFNWVFGKFTELYNLDMERQTDIFASILLNYQGEEIEITDRVYVLIANYYDNLCTLYEETTNTDELYLALLLKNIINVNLSMQIIESYYDASYDLVELDQQSDNYAQALGTLLE